jgi:hypothetical protein
MAEGQSDKSKPGWPPGVRSISWEGIDHLGWVRTVSIIGKQEGQNRLKHRTDNRAGHRRFRAAMS